MLRSVDPQPRVAGLSARESYAEDEQLARQLAHVAGLSLLRVRAELAGAPAEELREEGDRRSHRLLTRLLAFFRPNDAVLSEEGADDPRRLSCRRVWIVDPLDGTREFAEPGRTDWAVHVALTVDGRVVAGAVDEPAAFAGNGRPVGLHVVRPAGPRLMVVSRTRPPEVAERVAGAIGARLAPMGSAGAKAMRVVRGEADVYLHAGGQYEWDLAAPAFVAQRAGLHVSRIDGSPLVFNQPNPWLPDVVMCRADLAAEVLAALRSV